MQKLIFSLTVLALATLPLTLEAATHPKPFVETHRLEAREAARGQGVWEYRLDARRAGTRVRVLDAAGGEMATLTLAFEAGGGTRVRFEGVDGARLELRWQDLKDGVTVTDLLTMESALEPLVRAGAPAPEGLAVLDRNRATLDFLAVVFSDVYQQMFLGEAGGAGTLRQLRPTEGEEFVAARPDTPEAIGEPEGDCPLNNYCTGSIYVGIGLSTSSFQHASYVARQDANYKCTNFYCYGCCEMFEPPLCDYSFTTGIWYCSIQGQACSRYPSSCGF